MIKALFVLVDESSMSAIQTVPFSAGYAALQTAQAKLNNAAVDIAQNGPTPANATDLIEARTQFAAGVKAIHIQDQISQSLLALLP
jgi:flagellar hook protein FlgE